MTAQNATACPSRLMKKREVIDVTGLSESTIWRREQEGRFPPRIRLGQRMTVWRESDVHEWLADPVGYQQAGGEGA
ncbi:helix-turn-helix transcriptional regulator [Alkalilimnicola ehrlichii MLHE-1]|uniref:Phage transcriptional regulator, AlpA n=1 Tax=Alkalilimnicola ehrlichii (strain ATCC BAA-1101 / DSM 17681 / MLHE-1) TaxID=187272 RepID=Q0A9S3_ALKEH|nr:AlpA family phage regulatory protein [Alkalilimnicola ehrlichii]ABI56414.1 phage transcriptional regulator, AlpA [Alkalilimnicola ehrlichii MLHE-1]